MENIIEDRSAKNAKIAKNTKYYRPLRGSILSFTVIIYNIR